jgi:adenylate cyclase
MAAAEVAEWLIGPGRLSGDATVVASGLAERLRTLGMPLHRLRMAMRVDNPLLSAWGISWTPETGASVYTVSQALLDTSAYAGSPVQYVIETRQTFRQRLDRLEASSHTILRELASVLTRSEDSRIGGRGPCSWNESRDRDQGHA